MSKGRDCGEVTEKVKGGEGKDVVRCTEERGMCR